jgi:hypothetical protein
MDYTPGAAEDGGSSGSLFPCSGSDRGRMAGTRLGTVESVGTLWVGGCVDAGAGRPATVGSSKGQSDWVRLDRTSLERPE